MGLFKDILGANESLFRDTVALDYDYQPKVMKFREREQMQFALAIKPLLQERNGRNLFVYGAPGIGKTVACRHVLRELEDETDTVVPIYINCWKNNSAYKILLEMCNILGIRFITTQKTSELFDKIKAVLNKKAAVFVFDEIDKLEDFDVLYMVLEDVYKKSIFLITNYKEKVEQLDERIMSRLSPDFVEFMQYNKDETRGILAERMKYAFVPGVWDDAAFDAAVEKTASLGDLRQGLFIMKEAGNLAEEEASRKIGLGHVKNAILKVERFRVDKYAALDDEAKELLEFVKKKPGMKIGELFQAYADLGKVMSYKQFARKIEKLAADKLIVAEKVIGGKDGTTTIVKLPGSDERKLTEF